MELPVALREALEEAAGSVPVKGLAEATAGLSERYREAAATGAGYFRGEADFAAYAAFRMPATYAAVLSVLGEVVESLPGWSPGSLLDVGAGPGTASWAAVGTWPGIPRVTLLEREEGMLRLGKRLAEASDSGALAKAEWVKADLLTNDGELPPHDLVVASYSLNELPEPAALATVQRLWEATKGVLAIIEPGTPTGFRRIRAYRDLLIRGGAGVLAPCPHSSTCPMDGDGWCHFSRRVPRSRLHRQVKAGELGFEDEKYSYAVFTRIGGSPADARVLGHPRVTKGYVAYDACTPSGLGGNNIPRRDKEAYKAAKDLEWGSGLRR